MSKKDKQTFEDDCRTISNMNVEGMPGYDPHREKKEKTKKQMNELRISRKERWAMIWGAYKAYMPLLLAMLAGFGIVMALIAFWLS